MIAHRLRSRCLPLAGIALALPLLASLSAVAQETPAPLPIERVVMFNAGVAFFEHRGEVDGDAQVELRFNTSDINDLLKSMVLQDLGGGKISTVSYGSKDPITRTLQTFAIDLTHNPTLAELLSQVRGEKVEIEAPDLVVGTIVGVEQRPRPVDDQVVQITYVNVLTEDGLRSVSLENVGRIELVNPKLDAELRQALSVLASSHATDKKTVTLNFTGQGQRPVRVGYVQESPVWKTSYRLVLRDDEEPLLQGWAIVENTTESDWEDVQLTLVSGRPISFAMDLYEPLYVDRPVVQPPQYASLRPRTYEQDLDRAAEAGKLAELERSSGLRRQRNLAKPEQPPGLGAMMGGYGYGAAAAPEAEAIFDISQGVSSAAQGGDLGELFQYVIDMPVTVQRGSSAMLPIVNSAVQGQKIAIYNQSVHAEHPLNGFKLKNTTDLHLMQGPITVFDDGAYAGDAQIEDIQPGNERLISYALDLDVEVAPTTKAQPQQLVSLRIVKGTLHLTHKYSRTQEYLIKNSAAEATDLLVEYPFDPSWKLVEPQQPTEQTRDEYRFAVTVEPGQSEPLTIQEEQVVSQTVEITGIPDEQIRIFLNAKVVSDEVKQALEEVVARKTALQEVTRQREQYQQRIDEITREQQRIGNNMSQLPRDSELYRRYVTKLSEQEDEIDRLRTLIFETQERETELRRALDDYLLSLDVR